MASPSPFPSLHASTPTVRTNSYHDNAVRAEDTEQEAAILEQTTAWIPKTPVRSEVFDVALRKPVVIPRVDTVGRLAVPLPFMRAYSPDLRPHGIGEHDFVAFIDNLAVAQAGPAPLQALDRAGTAVGIVPHHWAMAAGVGMNVVAGVGTATVVTRRTRHFMDKVNQEYFAPRGLRAALFKDPQLSEKLRLDPTLPLLAPLNLQSADTTTRDRRMHALAPYIAPLTLNVPPPTEQRNMLDKLSAKQIEQRRQKKEKKQQRKADKMRRKQASASGMQTDSSANTTNYISDSSSTSSSSSDSEEVGRKIQKINRKAELDWTSKGPKKAAKIEEKRLKEIQKVEAKGAKSDRKKEKKMAKGEKKQGKKAVKDLKEVAKMEFIVIEKLAVEDQPVQQ